MIKTYKELIIQGDYSELNCFLDDIVKFVGPQTHWMANYDVEINALCFTYFGTAVIKSTVFLSINSIKKGRLSVSNVIPREVDELSIDEYNLILDTFVNEIINPYKREFNKVSIYYPETDELDPLFYLSKDAFEKLRVFCLCANRSILHPLDENRFRDFIIKSFEDGRYIPMSILQNLLCDDKYWIPWETRKAYNLSKEYEDGIRLLEQMRGF